MNMGRDKTKPVQNSQSSARRGSGRPFPKGVSGNPGGKPKLSPELRAALDTLEPEALACLRNAIARGDREGVEAAKYVLNRKYGAPSQELKHTSDEPFKLVLDLVPPTKRIGAGASERLPSAHRQVSSGEASEP